jgi:hypothetical protein
VRGFRQWIPGLYVQDRWRLSRRLTLDLGLRHEWATVPREVNNRVANLDVLTDPAPRVGNPLFRNPSYGNFAPRAGLAWDVLGTGATVVRAGYGISHDLLLSHFFLLSGVRNAPAFLLAETRRLTPGDFPTGAFARLVSGGTIDVRVERIPPDVDQPYVQHWNLNVQQTLAGGPTLRVAYVGSHGVHLAATVEDANLVTPLILPDGRRFYPQGGTRLNPALGMIRDRRFDGHSFYHAGIAEFRHRWGAGFQLQASYAFSKSIDDDSGTFAQTESDNAIGIPVNGDHKFNRGPSNFDITHYFTANGLWDIPYPHRQLGFLLANWRAGAFWTISTGVPFTPTLAYDAARTGTSRPDRRGGQRPDVAAGFTGDAITGDPVRWFNPAAFVRPVDGFLGNLGRNTLRGPGLAAVDVALIRQIAVPRAGDNVRLDFRVEVFNLLNHTNFYLPAPNRMQVFTRTAVPEDVGRITTAAPGREFQLGLKASF